MSTKFQSVDQDSRDDDDKPNHTVNRPRPSKEFKEPQKRVIRFKTGFHNVIYDVLKARGWKETESEMDWDIHWCDREWMFEVFDHAHLESWQRVNHFRNDRELCRKDLLIKNVKRQKRNLEREKNYEEAAKYDFCPTTYVLPSEYALFAEEFKKSSNTTWIMKPIGKSQGKGIFLFQKLSQISKWRSEHRWKPENSEIEAYVVQRYISNPFLIGGKKFDVRIYVLVTCFAPLTVYLYRSGFARFSNTRYSAHTSDISNQFVHLTNVAIQKTAENYNKETGCKWGLRELKLHLITRYGLETVDKLFCDVQGLILRSLLSVQKVMINDKHCFELYGYDVMFDADLRPWLIEVNASPSLSANTPEDYKLKFQMLNHVMDIVDLEKRLKGKEVQVGGFDLIYKDGDLNTNRASVYKSFLGCELPEHHTLLPPVQRESQNETQSQTNKQAQIGRRNTIG